MATTRKLCSAPLAAACVSATRVVMSGARTSVHHVPRVDVLQAARDVASHLEDGLLRSWSPPKQGRHRERAAAKRGACAGAPHDAAHQAALSRGRVEEQPAVDGLGQGPGVAVLLRTYTPFTGLGWCLIFLAADPCCLAAAVNRPVMQVAHTRSRGVASVRLTPERCAATEAAAGAGGRAPPHLDDVQAEEVREALVRQPGGGHAAQVVRVPARATQQGGSKRSFPAIPSTPRRDAWRTGRLTCCRCIRARAAC